MGNSKKSWKGRGAHPLTDSADVLFERALSGDATEASSSFDPRQDRKTLQLCRQVQRAVMLALAGECGDDLLRELVVDSVDPAGGAAHLLVRVVVPRPVSVIDAMRRLEDRSPQLRSIVAGSICRKRAPMLSFIAVPMVPPIDIGGEDARNN